MPRPDPTRSFRKVPPAIYVALAVGAAGALPVAIATMLASGDFGDRFVATQRWYLVDLGCDTASTILLALGLLELARRHVGAQRVLTQAAACLGFASLAWLGARPLITLLEPSDDHLPLVYDWLGHGVSVLSLAGVVLLTLGADAWRRAPIAAAVLVVLGATTSGIPVVGKEISELVGPDPMWRQLYGLGRLGLYDAALLFMAAALAAGGRDPAPDARAAATGLRIARGALIFRIVAAASIAVIVIGGRSQGAAKLVAFAGPAVMVITMLVFAVALQRIASARLEGMPRLLLSLGAALTLWWGAIQLDQLTALLEAMKSSGLGERAMEAAQWLSIPGPIAATLGLTLVGSAIASFARRRGDVELREVATIRTTAFLLTTLASIGLQSQLSKATSISGALAIVGLAAIAAIVALVVLAGLLARAAESIEATPGIPPARVV